MSGWGAELAPHVFRWGAVHNFAKGGATTESFREEGLWDQLLDEAGHGDLALIQFGHNDQKHTHLAADVGYSANLLRMIGELADKGVKAVLCTPVERRNFKDGVQTATLAAYAAAVRAVGLTSRVEVIDLNAWTTMLYTNEGERGSIAYFTHLEAGNHAHWSEGLEDNTHFSQKGAVAVAGQVARELFRIGGAALPA